MHDIDVGRQLEQFARQMRQAAGTGRGEIQFPRLRLGERDQFLHVPGGEVGRDYQHLGHGGDQRHRREILQRIIGDLFHARADSERARTRDCDGVTVGWGLGDRVGAEHAALAAAVVDQHRLLGNLGHALSDHARDNVIGAAGRERHDQLDGLCGEILRRGQGWQQ